MPNLTIAELSEEQRNEQIDRENELDAVNGTEGDQIEDSGGGAVIEGEGGEQQTQPREKPIAMSPQDQKRLEMANRFKRPGAEVPFDGDMTKPENLYGEIAAEALVPDPNEPEPGVPAEQREQQQPRMITRTVRNQQITRTEDEWLELATKVDAADSYLEEGRALLEDAKRIKAERAGQDPQHPEGRTSTQDHGQDDDHSNQERHNAPDLKSVVEKIQFGDPEEAARELGAVINTTALKIANEGHIQRLVNNDLAKSKADLKAFREANPTLDNDPIASNVIENAVYRIYRDEIRSLGVEEALIPQDPKALADWHRLYRVHGREVSKPADVLVKAKAQLDSWRGAPPQKQATRPKETAPRVNVNVDRTERRMAIPVQPSRAVAPRRDAPPVQQESSRKQAVAEMRRARGQLVD